MHSAMLCLHRSLLLIADRFRVCFVVYRAENGCFHFLWIISHLHASLYTSADHFRVYLVVDEQNMASAAFHIF